MLDPAVQPGPVDVDDQADAVVQGDGQRLGAAHPAAAPGQRQGAGQGAAEPLLGDGGEGLVGALDDALGADVDPGAGGHLAVHGQAQLLQPAELRPVGPVRDQVGVGDQHPRRPLVGPHHPDRPAGLDQHGLVGLQVAQRADHGVEGAPVAGGAAGAAVDDQVVGALGVLRVEVVHQHPQRGLGGPPLGGQGGAAGCADGTGAFHDQSPCVHCSDCASASPRAGCSSTPLRESGRSWWWVRQGPVTDSAAVTTPPLPTQLDGGLDLRREPAVGTGAGRAGGAQGGDHRGGGRGRGRAGRAARGRGPRSAARWPAPGSARRRPGAACGPPTSPSRRGPPASPSWGWSRPRPGWRAA